MLTLSTQHLYPPGGWHCPLVLSQDIPTGHIRDKHSGSSLEQEDSARLLTRNMLMNTRPYTKTKTRLEIVTHRRVDLSSFSSPFLCSCPPSSLKTDYSLVFDTILSSILTVICLALEISVLCRWLRDFGILPFCFLHQNIVQWFKHINHTFHSLSKSEKA